MEINDSSTGRKGKLDEVSIDIRHSNEDIITCIRQKMETICYSHCICRVKESLRTANEKAYIPYKVSVGPYHGGKDGLKEMEDQKWRYAHALLSRKPNLEAVLDDCVTALRELEHRAHSCYTEEIQFRNNDFLQMMLVDGCFIIELFLKYSIKRLRRRDDPIFTTPGMLFELRCDLVLLENQIPLFVLQRLFQLVPIPKECTHSLSELAFRFFRNMIPGEERLHRLKFNQEGNHLLDLICHCLLRTYPRLQPKQSRSEKQLRPATELQANGIKIKKGRTENLLDIKFVNGVLEIPPISVHQYTESLLRNLIALEQCSCENVPYITSYAILMKSLLCSDKDVKLLQKRGIFTNYDAIEEEIVKLFDKLCEEVSLKESYYNGVCEQVNGYKGSQWHQWSKKLKSTYHKNPSFRSWLLIAIFIICLILVATLFSVFKFLLHHD